jgi:pyrrolidone-carboxylate peptidase
VQGRVVGAKKDAAATGNRRFRGGFLHVPSLTQQAREDEPRAMTLDDIVRGIGIVLEAATDRQGRTP